MFAQVARSQDMFRPWWVIVTDLAEKPFFIGEATEAGKDTAPENGLVLEDGLGCMVAMRTMEKFAMVKKVGGIQQIAGIHGVLVKR